MVIYALTLKLTFLLRDSNSIAQNALSVSHEITKRRYVHLFTTGPKYFTKYYQYVLLVLLRIIYLYYIVILYNFDAVSPTEQEITTWVS